MATGCAVSDFWGQGNTNTPGHSRLMNEEELQEYFKMIGARGGKAGTGRAKTRSKEHYRRIAKERWRLEREKRVNKGG